MRITEIRQRVKFPPPSGLVSLNDWACAVESVMHLGLPWRMLRSQLATSKSNDSMIDYHEWFNELAIKGANTDVRMLYIQYIILYNFFCIMHSNAVYINQSSPSGLLSLSFQHFSSCSTLTRVCLRLCIATAPPWRPSLESQTQTTQVKLIITETSYTWILWIHQWLLSLWTAYFVVLVSLCFLKGEQTLTCPSTSCFRFYFVILQNMTSVKNVYPCQKCREISGFTTSATEIYMNFVIGNICNHERKMHLDYQPFTKHVTEHETCDRKDREVVLWTKNRLLNPPVKTRISPLIYWSLHPHI